MAFFGKNKKGAPQNASLLEGIVLPKHVGIIMDGNGRWAKQRGLPRKAGHREGAQTFRTITRYCSEIGIEYLTVYAFSTENWKRPQREVNLLMHLFATTLMKEMPLFHQENVRLRFLGDLDALPKETREVFFRGLDETSDHTGMTFALAVNYGSRSEIVRAARNLAANAAMGNLSPDEIDEELFSANLYTAGIPDPDLLIRTSGEMRLSNYLLWQLAYTEFYVTDLYWPDFSRWEFLRAVRSYQSRDRRFGGVKAK